MSLRRTESAPALPGRQPFFPSMRCPPTQRRTANAGAERSPAPCPPNRIEPLPQRRLRLAGLVEVRPYQPVGQELLRADLTRAVVRVVGADAASERRRAGIRAALQVRRRRLRAVLADVRPGRAERAA